MRDLYRNSPYAAPEAVPLPRATSKVAIVRVLETVFRRWYIVLGVPLAMAAAGILVSAIAPPRYEAEIKFLVKNDRAQTVVAADLYERLYSQPARDESRINSEVALMESTDTLLEVIRSVGVGERLRLEPPNPQIDVTRAALEELTENITVVAPKNSNIITVRYFADDPARAVSVLDALADSYLSAHLAAQQNPGAKAVFEVETARAQSDVKAARATLAEYRRQKGIVLLEQQKQLLLEEAKGARVSARDLTSTLLAKIAEAHKIENQIRVLPKTVTSQRSIHPNQFSIERLNTMRAELVNQRVDLMSKFFETDPLIVALDRKIENVTGGLEEAQETPNVQITELLNPLRASLEQSLAIAVAEIEGLSERKSAIVEEAQRLEGTLQSLESSSPEHEMLTLKVEDAEERYELYRRKLEEAHVAEEMDRSKIANVKLVQAPLEPMRPSAPEPLLIVACGLLLGTALGIGAAFSVDRLGNVVYTPAELEEAAGLPVLGTLPKHAQLTEKSHA